MINLHSLIDLKLLVTRIQAQKKNYQAHGMSNHGINTWQVKTSKPQPKRELLPLSEEHPAVSFQDDEGRDSRASFRPNSAAPSRPSSAASARSGHNRPKSALVTRERPASAAAGRLVERPASASNAGRAVREGGKKERPMTAGSGRCGGGRQSAELTMHPSRDVENSKGGRVRPQSAMTVVNNSGHNSLGQSKDQKKRPKSAGAARKKPQVTHYKKHQPREEKEEVGFDAHQIWVSVKDDMAKKTEEAGNVDAKMSKFASDLFSKFVPDEPLSLEEEQEERMARMAETAAIEAEIVHMEDQKKHVSGRHARQQTTTASSMCPSSVKFLIEKFKISDSVNDDPALKLKVMQQKEKDSRSFDLKRLVNGEDYLSAKLTSQARIDSIIATRRGRR